MSRIAVYDPAVCCSSGVCGPDADRQAAEFNGALDAAKKKGVHVDRFTLAHQPAEYVSNAEVKRLLDTEGVECLPLVFIDGEILSKAGYPAKGALMEKLGLESGAAAAPSGGCCGPATAPASSGGCCGPADKSATSETV